MIANKFIEFIITHRATTKYCNTHVAETKLNIIKCSYYLKKALNSLETPNGNKVQGGRPYISIVLTSDFSNKQT